MAIPSKPAKSLSLVVVLALARAADGAPPPGAHHPTRLLVKLREQAVAAVPGGIREVGSLPVVKSYRRQPGLVVVHSDRPLAEVMAALRARPEVLYVEPDYIVSATETPDDPSFSLLWGFENSGATINGDPGIAGADARATQAWDFWQGAQDFRIAIADTGVDYTHPDLVDNMWTNSAETPGNGEDDDQNGYVDDVHGFSIFGMGADPMDDHGHGTHVAGIIGARGDNGVGVVGVNWRCRIVPIKFLDSTGTGFLSDAITALEYALDNDIKLSNHSWSCYSCYSQALYDTIAMAQAAGHLFVAAAGNGILGVSTNTDDFPNYPSGYDLSNIIAVAACDQKDRKAVFSNDGAMSVDLAAPGVNTLSTHLYGDYLFRSGTSMATPMVTGGIALAWTRMPHLDWLTLRERVLLTARGAPSFSGLSVTGGILDIAALVADCNHNQLLDDLEISGGKLHDCNDNSLLDVCEHDCNGNGLADECDVKSAASLDCNANGIPDECEPDCNSNSAADSCDVTSGTSDDCNQNLIPDECEPGHDLDCNSNKTADLCDIASGVGKDCNGNAALDECEIMNGHAADCTGNGVPDECEPDCNNNGVADSCDIAGGTSLDLDGNTLPDECAGFSLVPITASGQHYISGNTLTLVRGAQRVIAEVRLSGWDPDQDGAPGLRLYEAALDLGTDPPFGFAELTCANNEDCIGDSLCVDGACDVWGSLNVDTFRSDFVFAGLDVIATSNVFSEFPQVFALLIDIVESVADDGETHYAATLVIDTHEEGLGQATVGFSQSMSYMHDPKGNTIDVPGFHPLQLVMQDGFDLQNAASMQNCFAAKGEPVECIMLDANQDTVVNSQDVRAFNQLMSGPVP